MCVLHLVQAWCMFCALTSVHKFIIYNISLFYPITIQTKTLNYKTNIISSSWNNWLFLYKPYFVSLQNLLQNLYTLYYYDFFLEYTINLLTKHIFKKTHLHLYPNLFYWTICQHVWISNYLPILTIFYILYKFLFIITSWCNLK